MALNLLNSQRIHSELRQQIVDRTIPPGTKLTESSLSRMWNVSRTPIREVLRQLESEGFISFSPYRGFIVNAITIEDVDDLYTIKIYLDGLAGRLATPAVSGNPKRLEFLEKLCKEMERLSVNVDIENYVKENSQFHSFLRGYCGNEWLIKILENLNSQINRFIVNVVNIPHRMEHSVGEHWDIYRKLKSGNGKQVEKSIGNHFEKALNDLKRELIRVG